MVRGSTNRRAFAIAGIGALFGARATKGQSTPAGSPAPVGAPLFRVDLPATSLPAAPVAVGAVGVSMAPGSRVSYPEGASGPSVAIDHVIAGGYQIISDGDVVHLDAAANLTEIAAGETTSVNAGETIVLLQNEAAQEITAGGEETRTLTVGVFSLQQGSGESDLEGSIEQEILGGTVLQTLPESGLTITVTNPGSADEIADPVVQMPVRVSTGEDWVVVVSTLGD